MKGVNIGGHVSTVPRIIGKQVYGSLYDCNDNHLRDEEYLRNLVGEAAVEGNMTF